MKFKYITLMTITVLLFSSVAHASVNHIQGPHFKNKDLTLTGEIIAIGAPFKSYDCAMLRVIPNQDHSGGRAWICMDQDKFNLKIGDYIKSNGVSHDTRLTRMGPMMRVAPILINPNIEYLKY